MRSYGTIGSRTLDWAHRLTASLSRTGRSPLAFGIAASLLVAALGPPSPARADPPPDPAARLQIVLKKILVRHDRDLVGSGEMRLYATLCPPNGTVAGCADGNGVTGIHNFSGSTGDEVSLERVVPRDGDATTGEASVEAGVPVYAGQRYEFMVRIIESDLFGGNDMGLVVAPVDEERGWGIGTFTVLSDDSDDYLQDFALTYEIRPAPLPDLLNRGIRLIDSGDKQFYCVTVMNVGERPTGLVPLAVRADGVLVRALRLPALDVNQTTEHCAIRSELPVRQHQLSFTVDEGRQIPEMNETNNYYEWKIQAVAPTSAASNVVPSPEPKPSEAQADLAVRAIRINGQAPDGKDDCKAGKNAVSVVVKNVGTGDAGSFAVRLAVDGDDVDAAVDGLDAGQEREVRFDDVQLKKGERTLSAVADAEHAIAESKEDNNELKVTARCKDAG